MSIVQPDLFGEYDARVERQRLERQPQTCPSCGTTEPNGFLLNNNHGYRIADDGTLRPPRFDDQGTCTARWLVTNHITHNARTGNDGGLTRSIARGRQLGLDVDAIITAARKDPS